MGEIKVGDKVVIGYLGAFELEGIVTNIDGNAVTGEITSPVKYFRAPKDFVFPINEEDNESIQRT